MRICSFLPSATEIVYALGLSDSLMAVSHECDYPPEAKTKPKVVRSRFDASAMSSGEIHIEVARLMAAGERIYEVDDAVLAEAAPDLVLTQELCDVCAVSFDDVQQAVVNLKTPPRLISLDPTSLTDVINDVERVGEAVDRRMEASKIASSLRHEVESVREKAEKASDRPKVACIEWVNPFILAGHWVPEMVEIAGGSSVLVGRGEPSKTVSLEQLIEQAPDILVFMPCGMDVARATKEIEDAKCLALLADTPAVRNDRVYAADGGAIFSRSGPRLVEGVGILGKILHPEIFGDSLPSEYSIGLKAGQPRQG